MPVTASLVSAGMAEQFLEKFAYKKYRDTKKWPDSIFHYNYFKLFVTIQCKILCTENFNLSIQDILAKYSKYNCGKVHACATFQNNKQFVHLPHYKIGLQVFGRSCISSKPVSSNFCRSTMIQLVAPSSHSATFLTSRALPFTSLICIYLRSSTWLSARFFS